MLFFVEKKIKFFYFFLLLSKWTIYTQTVFK